MENPHDYENAQWQIALAGTPLPTDPPTTTRLALWTPPNCFVLTSNMTSAVCVPCHVRGSDNLSSANRVDTVDFADPRGATPIDKTRFCLDF